MLSSSRFLVTLSSLHLFNFTLCLLLFVATKEHRDRWARQAAALCRAGVFPALPLVVFTLCPVDTTIKMH